MWATGVFVETAFDPSAPGSLSSLTCRTACPKKRSEPSLRLTPTIQFPRPDTSSDVAYVPGSALRGAVSLKSLAGANGYQVAGNGPVGLPVISFAIHTWGEAPVTTSPVLVTRANPK